MNDFLKMDIFFFVATLALLSVGTMLGIAGFYLVKILKRAEALSRTVQEEGRHIVEDIAHLRETVKENANVETAARFVGAIFREKGKSSSKKGRGNSK